MSTGLGNIALGVGRSAGKTGSGNVGKAADIIDFAESAWGVEMELYPVQRVILKCHYGIPLDDTKEFLVDTSWRLDKKVLFTEASYLRYLYDEGRSNIREVIPGQERREMVLSIGRRSGKTMLSAAIAAYETYKLILKGDPHSYYGIMPSNPIQIISIATDKDQAGILYQDVSGHFRACLAYETDIITDEGTKPIGSLVGTTQTILTRDGSWVEAPIRAFGVQPLFKITLRRQGIEKIVYATENHRWFARDARKAYRGKGFHEFLTSDLRPGKHHLQTTFGRSYKNRIIPSSFGVAHGFTFGDGHSPRNRNASYVDMFGEKDKALLPFFSMCPQKACERSQGNSKVNKNEGYIRTTALPNFFKDFPPIKENKSYLLGWLMGYFAADGTVSSGVEIASVDRKNLEFVRDVCILLGIGVFSIRGHTRISNLTERPFTMYKLKFLRSTLDEDFFVIPHHKKAFLKLGGSNVKRNAMNWTVVSVEPTDRVEKVFCATVDKHRDFVLDGNLATGNCDFFGPYTANNTMSYARFQTPKDIDKYGRYSQDPTARASLRVTFRSCIAKGLRGAGNIVIIMDEAAHFTDGGQSSAASVYDAVTPSAATFSPKDPNDKKVPIGKVEGRVISISSPLGKQGHFYQLYQLGYTGTEAAENMLCIQAPTWEVNPTLPLSEYEKFYYKDANVFFTEFGGQFTDRTRGWLEREEDLLVCVEPGLQPQVNAPARLPHFIGIDVGLVKDPSAVAIGHMEVIGGQNKVVVDLVDQIQAGVGKYKDVERLDFEGVADWILKLSKKFYIAEGMLDQYVGIPFEQALVKRGLRQIKMVHMTRQLNSDIFKNFKDMMWEKWLVLYDYPIPVDPKEGSHCPYILQLMELQAEYLSKYVTLVQAPQVAGKHDDMADALVRMVWQASHSLSKPRIIAGVRNRNGIAGGANPGAARRARLNARRMGSSPDRQASRVNRNMVRGR